MVPEDPANGPENPENGGESGLTDHGPAREPDDEADKLASALQAPPLDEASDAYLRRAQLAEDRLGEVLGAYRKLRTENEGYRERLTRNLERRFEQRRERLLLKFIDILDNLDRALEAAETTYAGDQLVQGLILVRTQLLQTLKDEGLERVPVLGLPYDPHTSEAVATRPVEEREHHHLVVKDLLRAYRLNGRLVRPARVVVGEHPAGAEPQPTPSAEEIRRTPTAVMHLSQLPLPPQRLATQDETPTDDDPPLPEPPELHGDPELDAIIARAEGRAAPAEPATPEAPAAETDRVPAKPVG